MIDWSKRPFVVAHLWMRFLSCRTAVRYNKCTLRHFQPLNLHHKGMAQGWKSLLINTQGGLYVQNGCGPRATERGEFRLVLEIFLSVFQLLENYTITIHSDFDRLFATETL